MPRMKIQRTINKNKQNGIEEFGSDKQKKNGMDNRNQNKEERKRRKNPNNRTFQDVENSGGSNTENGIKMNGKGMLDENNLSEIVTLLSKSLKQKLMKMITGMTENNQTNKRRSLLPQA